MSDPVHAGDINHRLSLHLTSRIKVAIPKQHEYQEQQIQGEEGGRLHSSLGRESESDAGRSEDSEEQG
jgi:hypothetical protein